MTDAKIFLVNHDDRQLTPIAASDYIDEDQLQRYLEEYPDLLAGDQIDPNAPRRWLLIAREMGAINIPLRELADNVDQIPTDEPVFVYCQSGWRAALATGALHNMGYENVRSFPPSFAGWEAAGEEIEQ